MYVHTHRIRYQVISQPFTKSMRYPLITRFMFNAKCALIIGLQAMENMSASNWRTIPLHESTGFQSCIEQFGVVALSHTFQLAIRALRS